MAEIDLEALAARVERLEGPCRETDRAIMEALALKPDYAADWGPRDNCRPAPFAYTGSLDAAVALLPGGAMRRSGDSAVGLMGTFFCDIVRPDGCDFHSLANNEPCAIVSAALRARLMEGEGE